MSKQHDEQAPGSKDLATGDIEPPLPHDEYAEQFAKRQEAALKEMENRQRKTAKQAEPAPGLPGENVDPKTTGHKK